MMINVLTLIVSLAFAFKAFANGPLSKPQPSPVNRTPIEMAEKIDQSDLREELRFEDLTKESFFPRNLARLKTQKESHFYSAFYGVREGVTLVASIASMFAGFAVISVAFDYGFVFRIPGVLEDVIENPKQNVKPELIRFLKHARGIAVPSSVVALAVAFDALGTTIIKKNFYVEFFNKKGFAVGREDVYFIRPGAVMIKVPNGDAPVFLLKISDNNEEPLGGELVSYLSDMGIQVKWIKDHESVTAEQVGRMIPLKYDFDTLLASKFDAEKREFGPHSQLKFSPTASEEPESLTNGIWKIEMTAERTHMQFIGDASESF